MNGIWIRSQDRERLILASGVRYGKHEIGYVEDLTTAEHCVLENSHSNIVGIYLTKERALEVLDEIQHAIAGEAMVNVANILGVPTSSVEDQIRASTYFVWQHSETPILVFEMPLK